MVSEEPPYAAEDFRFDGHTLVATRVAHSKGSAIANLEAPAGSLHAEKKKITQPEQGSKTSQRAGSTCQVPGCGASLIESKVYYQRYSICKEHARTPVMTLNGKECRFCSQCARFHELNAFDGKRQSCRVQLARHNERRRLRSKAEAAKQLQQQQQQQQGRQMLDHSDDSDKRRSDSPPSNEGYDLHAQQVQGDQQHPAQPGGGSGRFHDSDLNPAQYMLPPGVDQDTVIGLLAAADGGGAGLDAILQQNPNAASTLSFLISGLQQQLQRHSGSGGQLQSRQLRQLQRLQLMGQLPAFASRKSVDPQQFSVMQGVGPSAQTRYLVAQGQQALQQLQQQQLQQQQLASMRSGGMASGSMGQQGTGSRHSLQFSAPPPGTLDLPPPPDQHPPFASEDGGAGAAFDMYPPASRLPTLSTTPLPPEVSGLFESSRGQSAISTQSPPNQRWPSNGSLELELLGFASMLQPQPPSQQQQQQQPTIDSLSFFRSNTSGDHFRNPPESSGSLYTGSTSTHLASGPFLAGSGSFHVGSGSTPGGSFNLQGGSFAMQGGNRGPVPAHMAMAGQLGGSGSGFFGSLGSFGDGPPVQRGNPQRSLGPPSFDQMMLPTMDHDNAPPSFDQMVQPTRDQLMAPMIQQQDMAQDVFIQQGSGPLRRLTGSGSGGKASGSGDSGGAGSGLVLSAPPPSLNRSSHRSSRQPDLVDPNDVPQHISSDMMFAAVMQAQQDAHAPLRDMEAQQQQPGMYMHDSRSGSVSRGSPSYPPEGQWDAARQQAGAGQFMVLPDQNSSGQPGQLPSPTTVAAGSTAFASQLAWLQNQQQALAPFPAAVSESQHQQQQLQQQQHAYRSSCSQLPVGGQGNSPQQPHLDGSQHSSEQMGSGGMQQGQQHGQSQGQRSRTPSSKGDDVITRLSLKLTKLTPADLPPDLAMRLENWLAQADATLMEAVIRPGCVQLIIDVQHPASHDFAAFVMAGGSPSSAGVRLVRALGQELLGSCSVTVQAGDQVLQMEDGHGVAYYASTADMEGGPQVPRIRSIVPIAVMAGEPTQLLLFGEYLTGPGISFFAKQQGTDTGLLASSCSSTTNSSRNSTEYGLPTYTQLLPTGPTSASAAAVDPAKSGIEAPGTDAGAAAGAVPQLQLLLPACASTGLVVVEGTRGSLLGNWLPLVAVQDGAVEEELNSLPANTWNCPSGRSFLWDLGQLLDYHSIMQPPASLLGSDEADILQSASGIGGSGERTSEDSGWHARVSSQQQSPQQLSPQLSGIENVVSSAFSNDSAWFSSSMAGLEPGRASAWHEGWAVERAPAHPLLRETRTAMLVGKARKLLHVCAASGLPFTAELVLNMCEDSQLIAPVELLTVELPTSARRASSSPLTITMPSDSPHAAIPGAACRQLGPPDYTLLAHAAASDCVPMLLMALQWGRTYLPQGSWGLSAALQAAQGSGAGIDFAALSATAVTPSKAAVHARLATYVTASDSAFGHAGIAEDEEEEEQHLAEAMAASAAMAGRGGSVTLDQAQPSGGSDGGSGGGSGRSGSAPSALGSAFAAASLRSFGGGSGSGAGASPAVSAGACSSRQGEGGVSLSTLTLSRTMLAAAVAAGEGLAAHAVSAPNSDALSSAGGGGSIRSAPSVPQEDVGGDEDAEYPGAPAAAAPDDFDSDTADDQDECGQAVLDSPRASVELEAPATPTHSSRRLYPPAAAVGTSALMESGSGAAPSSTTITAMPDDGAGPSGLAAAAMAGDGAGPSSTTTAAVADAVNVAAAAGIVGALNNVIAGYPHWAQGVVVAAVLLTSIMLHFAFEYEAATLQFVLTLKMVIVAHAFLHVQHRFWRG